MKNYIAAAQDLLTLEGLSEETRQDLIETIEWARENPDAQIEKMATAKLVAETMAAYFETKGGYRGWWK